MKTAEKIARALAECQARPDLEARARLYLAAFSGDVRALVASRPGGPALCKAVENRRVLFLSQLTELLHPLGLDTPPAADGGGI